MSGTRVATVSREKDGLKERGFGPWGVAIVPHTLIKLQDGTKIAMKIWYPR